jgi:uncharacterized protein
MRVDRVMLPVDDPPVAAVTAAIHHPERATTTGVLLAPGAGGDLDGGGLTALADVLAGLGVIAVRVNLPYREAGRRAAPRADRSVAGYTAVVAAVQARLPDLARWVVGGKSYGGRVGSLAVAQGLPVAGLLLYGYPLHPPGRLDRLRVDHWSTIAVPTLFLQGACDPFCDPDLLEAHLARLAGPATVHLVPGGDHSLHVTAKVSPDGCASNPRRSLTSLAPTLATWLDALD